MFDITNQESFDALSYWLNTYRELAEPGSFVILIGNKADLADRRQVPMDVIEKYANDNLIMYIETSALTAQNVETAFNTLAQGAYKNYKAKKSSSSSKGKRGTDAGVDLGVVTAQANGCNC